MQRARRKGLPVPKNALGRARQKQRCGTEWTFPFGGAGGAAVAGVSPSWRGTCPPPHHSSPQKARLAPRGKCCAPHCPTSASLGPRAAGSYASNHPPTRSSPAVQKRGVVRVKYAVNMVVNSGLYQQAGKGRECTLNTY